MSKWWDVVLSPSISWHLGGGQAMVEREQIVDEIYICPTVEEALAVCAYKYVCSDKINVSWWGAHTPKLSYNAHVPPHYW